jgi:hypothetical protein
MIRSSSTKQKKAQPVKTTSPSHRVDSLKQSASSVRVTKSPSKVASVISKKTTSPYVKRLKRYTKQGIKTVLLSPAFHSSFKLVSIFLVSSGLIYASYFFITKTFANEVIVSQSEIVARVAKLTLLPEEAPYEIVRVQDENDLRKQNPFYKDIKEGDYILMYKDMAVIYNLRSNSIVAMKRAGEER